MIGGHEARVGEWAEAGAPIGDPTLSVIVTCYNYGHFTRDCLDSILDQTRAPLEVIVVDDGSTDATGPILESYGSRIELLRTANRGQAAAFNAGFARSTGEVVLFVDADDLLHPHAIDTLLYHWSDDLAVLCFGLETVDGAGRSTGTYAASIEASTGDNRPELLETGTFSFPPTSGNAFSRRLLERVLPMPEPRWRISADCYLIRAAALFGRFDRVPAVLGSYRLHGGNNYAQRPETIPNLARDRANGKDIADALLDLADIAERFAEEPGDAEALRSLLAHRARAILDQTKAITGPPPGASGPRGAVGTGEARARPLGVTRADHTAIARLERSRWPGYLPLDRWTGVSRHGRETLRVPDLLDGTSSARSTERLAFRIGPTPDALQLALGLDPAPSADGSPCAAEVRLGGALVWQGPLSETRTVHVPVAPDPWARERCLDIEVSAQQGARRSGVGKPPPPKVRSLHLTAGNEDLSPYLPSGGLFPFAHALAAGLPAAEWEIDRDGGATMRAASARIGFEAEGPAALLLLFGTLPPVGWLHMRQDGRSLFSGWLGKARSLIIRLPPTRSAVAAHAIEVTFTPAVEAGGARLRIAEIGLLDLAASTIDDRSAPPVLNLGECVFLNAASSGDACLVSGWHVDPELGGACNVLAEAGLVFCAAEGATDLVLCLAVEPLFETVPGSRHVVAVSEDGTLSTAAHLVGPGEIEVALPRRVAQEPFSLVIHSVLVPAEGGAGAAATVAPLVLTRLELRGREAIGAPALLPRVQGTSPPRFQTLIKRSAALLLSETGASPSAELSALWRELVAFIETCDAKALILLASEDGSLEVLVRLGSAVRVQARLCEASAAAAPAGRPGERPEASALRAWLLAFLLCPAYRGPLPDIESLPAPLFWRPDALAAYLGQAPDIHSADARELYRAFLSRLLSGIDAVLARAPVHSAVYALADRCLRHMRSTTAIFGAGSLRALIRLRSRCIERLLIREGASLAMPRHSRASAGKLRLGILVRDVLANPEGWALLGMSAGIDRDRFDPVLIRMDKSADSLPTGTRFNGELCLAGRSVAQSVAAIRALQLDLFLTGCYVADYEKTSAIVAHRLAEVQIWHGAVCPTTGGFQSFDRALSCRATEPAEPQRHYTEQLVWIDGPLQCAYAFTDRAPRRADKLRQDLGLAPDAVMLVSGAMAHKVEDELLETWAAILSDASAAVLVLYPFASNWSMNFAPARFRDRLSRCLEDAGVPAERAIVLWTQTPKRVRAILASADLYLDSFPYTGATTVCEALSVGTPAVTLAGDSLRELTGTSWIRAYGLPELVARTPEEYQSLAADLANNGSTLKSYRDRLASADAPPPHNDPQQFGPRFSDALARIARGAELRPEAVPGEGRETSVSKIARTPSDVSRGPMPAPLPACAGRPPVRLVILAGVRTGSTLLCDLLNRTPGVICHYELFHDDMIQYADGTVEERAAIEARDEDPIAFLDALYLQAAEQHRSVFGFKHFAHLNAAVGRAVMADAETKLVHVSRENLLAQYASEKIAKQNLRWFSGKGDRAEPLRIAFRKRDFEAWERYQLGAERERASQLARLGREALFLDFKGIASPHTRDRLSSFLDVELVDWENPSFQRQNTPIIRDRFSNPEEMSAYFAKRGLDHWTAQE